MFGSIGKLLKLMNSGKLQEIGKQAAADRKKIHETPFIGKSKDGLVKITVLGSSKTKSANVDPKVASNSDQLNQDIVEANNSANDQITDADHKAMQAYAKYKDLVPSKFRNMIGNAMSKSND